MLKLAHNITTLLQNFKKFVKKFYNPHHCAVFPVKISEKFFKIFFNHIIFYSFAFEFLLIIINFY